MDPLTILAIIKGSEAIVVDLLPLFIHRNAKGEVERISVGVIMEATDARNAETLRLIGEANAQKPKASPQTP